MKNKNYYSMSIDEIFKKFQTSENGLSSREAEKRIDKNGKNITGTGHMIFNWFEWKKYQRFIQLRSQ